MITSRVKGLIEKDGPMNLAVALENPHPRTRLTVGLETLANALTTTWVRA